MACNLARDRPPSKPAILFKAVSTVSRKAAPNGPSGLLMINIAIRFDDYAKGVQSYATLYVRVLCGNATDMVWFHHRLSSQSMYQTTESIHISTINHLILQSR